MFFDFEFIFSFSPISSFSSFILDFFGLDFLNISRIIYVGINKTKFMIMLIETDEILMHINVPKSNPSHLVIVDKLFLTVKYIVLLNMTRNKRTKQLVVRSFLVNELCNGRVNIENHK